MSSEAGPAPAAVLLEVAGGERKGVEAQSDASTLVFLPLATALPALGSTLGLLGLLLVLLYAELSHPVDLAAFFLALGALATFIALVWRLHALYVALDRVRRLLRQRPAAEQPDVLTRLAALELWRDTLIRPLLAGAVIANLVVFAYVSDRYASLPPFLPLHYSAAGDVDRLGTPPEVFMMPGIGVVVLLANVFFAALLYRRERLASYFLVGASILVQLVLLVATANIISRA